MKTNRFSFLMPFFFGTSQRTFFNAVMRRGVVSAVVICLSLTVTLPVVAQLDVMADSFAADVDEVFDYEIFPYNEYEKLEKLKEQESCGIWADRTMHHLKRAVFLLENAPAESRGDLLSLVGLLDAPPGSEAVSLFEDDDRFTARCVAETLKKRSVIWGRVVTLLEAEQAESPYGVVPRMRFEDVARLYEKSDVIRQSLLLSRNGQDWIQFLQLTPLHGRLEQVTVAKNRLTAEPAEKYAQNYAASIAAESQTTAENIEQWLDAEWLSDEECRRISVLVNNVFAQQRRIALTPEQSQLLETPVIADWLAEMERWRSDPAHPLDLLAAYECYRQYRGTSDSSRLSVLTRQMIGSKNPELQAFGQSVQDEFSHAHVKFFISQYLINTMLPKMEPEYDRVRENVSGQQVVGHRRADTQLFVTLVPDPSRLLMTLNINGRVVTQTTASTFPATLHNQCHGVYSATKRVELTSRGIATWPADVTANSTVKLNNVETDLDIVPIVSDLIREIAREQYNNQYRQIQADTRAKVVSQAKQRIDSEADSSFLALNEQLDRFFFNVLRQRHASLEPYEAKTTEEWLLGSWYVATPYSLGSDAKEPATPQGAIGDVKVHELGVNAVLERFELAGKQMTLRELKRHLVAMIGQSDMHIPEEENDEVVVGFADLNPVGVRFMQNRVELSLNLKRLQVEDRAWNDFCVIVSYVPDLSEEGVPRLVRQGTVQLDGRLTLMQQVALRTIFSKIFLQLDELPLKPRLFDNDERFAELTTGFVRIENGWFAIALLPQPARPVRQNANPGTGSGPGSVIVPGTQVRPARTTQQNTAYRGSPQQPVRR